MRIYFLFFLLLATACNNDKPAEQEINSGSAKELQLTEAIRQYPDSILLVETLAQYYRDNGNYDKAIQTVNSVLNKDSLNGRLWDIKATLHFEDGDTLAAIKSYERSIDLDPQPGVIISLGALYAQTKNPLALVMADGLLFANKAQAEKEALFIKGLYYSSMNDKKQAIQFFDRCLALNFTFMEAYREKANALYSLGKYSEALQVLDKAVTLQNNFDEGYYFMGQNLEKLNRLPEAMEMYKRALMYDPEYIEAKQALSKLGVKVP
jgi:tetratricopeptide (TPR) repeat protein